MNGLSLMAIICLSGGLWIGANADCCGKGNCCKNCPNGWSQYNDRCFYYANTAADFSTAESNCISLGGNLVSIHSKEELSHIEGMLRTITGVNKRIWTGGFDSVKEGNWMWTDGTKFDFNYWGPGQPSNGGGTENCLELNWNNKPNDHQCYHKKPYMCARRL